MAKCPKCGKANCSCGAKNYLARKKAQQSTGGYARRGK